MVLKEWDQPGFGWYLQYICLWGKAEIFVGHRLSSLQSTDYCTTIRVQSSLLIWSCFILRFTVLTFCWFNLNLRGFGLVSPNLHPKCWSFLVGKPHGFVGETHHFRKPPIFWTFLGRTHLYRTCPKKTCKSRPFCWQGRRELLRKLFDEQPR